MNKKNASLFQTFMEDPKVFLRFARFFFPIFQFLALEDLQRQDTAFLDETLEGEGGHVLYRVQHRGKDFFVFVLEKNETAEEPLLCFQILKGVLQILELYLDSHSPEAEKPGFSLPPVFPVVFYGGEGDWGNLRNLKDLFLPVKGWERFYPRMEPKVILLANIPEHKLLPMKNILGLYLTLNHPEMLQRYEQKIFDRGRHFARKFSPEDTLLLKHLWEAFSGETIEDALITRAETEEFLPNEGAERIMNKFEEYFHEQFEMGKEEGLLQAAIAFLEDGVKLEKVSRLLDLSPAKILEYQKSAQSPL
ncbi:MAG TPA: Rpn family recombination-promoting nuclease/putative transposase [Thermotogota bacterium]|nr:Rpn family recombination-promoting nuclease/putative transposase [Thermotogota bacterium]HRW93576.1 Rpn family recombination-promoting nuclease/putative transposase [Thermotogota bacterium]